MSQFNYVLVGGGVASVNAVIGIREIDPAGSILLVGEEAYPPYDRPPLSKKMLTNLDLGLDEPESKFPNFYEDQGVTLMSGVRVESVDRDAKTVQLSNGESVGYEKLLLATGSRAVHVGVEGSDLQGVQTFRTMDDMIQLREAIRANKTIALVGMGYVGAELAASILAHHSKVIIVEQGAHPWARFASSHAGSYLRGQFVTNGAEMRFNHSLLTLKGDGHVSSIVLSSGEELKVGHVVFGVGVVLNDELARSSGLEVENGNGIIVDAHLRTSDPAIFAAGDVANFPDAMMGARRWHAEHHLHAKWEGHQAGRNMAGAGETFERIPYFWSDLFDDHMILRGDPDRGTVVKSFGTPDVGEFVDLYADAAGNLVAGLAMSKNEPSLDGISDALEEHIKLATPVAVLTKEMIVK